MAKKRELEAKSIVRLLAAGPVGLISTMYRDQPNLMAASWMMPLGFDPAFLGVAVHPGRLTHEFLTKTETFSVSIPNVDLLGAVHACGIWTGREKDKWEATGLTPEEPVEVEAPLVAEAVAHIECGVVDRQAWSDHDLFIARVLKIRVEAEAFGDGWNVEDDAGQILHHLGADRYAALGKVYRADLPETDD